LAHIFETVVQAAFWMHGASIGFFQNNIKRLSEDLIELKPTFLAGVPRVFSRIYQTVFNSVAQRNCVARYVFNKSYAAQCDRIRTGQPRDTAADTRIFIPLRNRVGLENCRFILTGAAPCPPYLLEFLKVAIGATVFQGYGLTETAAGLTVTSDKDHNVGHCGGPNASCEVKLMPIADMDYAPTDKPYPRGEVCEF
jgi:long-chain acyl-CoA synthetase